MDPVPEVFPLWVIALDYISGVVMWTLIGRTAMGFFLPEDSSFFFMRFFVRSTNPLLRFFCSSYPGLSLACSGSALCRLVFLHASVLPDALAAGLHGDGDAFISTGERNCRVDIPNPVPSVNPVPGTDFSEFSCQTSCSLVFRETILSNFDNFEGLQLDRFLLTE